MSGCALRTSLRFSVQKMKKGVRFLGCGFAMDAGAGGALGPLASGAWAVLLRVPMALSRPFAPAALAPAAPSPEACMGALCALLMSSGPSRARSRCPAPPARGRECACMYACMCACMRACMRACTCACMCACTCACMYAFICACMYAFIYACMHECTPTRPYPLTHPATHTPDTQEARTSTAARCAHQSLAADVAKTLTPARCATAPRPCTPHPRWARESGTMLRAAPSPPPRAHLRVDARPILCAHSRAACAHTQRSSCPSLWH